MTDALPCPSCGSAKVEKASQSASQLTGDIVREFAAQGFTAKRLDSKNPLPTDGWLVKGGGAAHTREKAVAAAAERFVVIVSSDKLVDRLAPPVPLELLEFGLAATLERLGDVRLRDAPASPDGGVIADYTGAFDDPDELATRLSATVGVVEHGLFAPALVSDVIVGRGQQAEHRSFS